MKKSKQSLDWKDAESETPDGLGLGLDSDEDEEIIDLEEIVEFSDEGDDQLDLDVELLDVDGDLDLGDLDTPLEGEGSEILTRESELEADLLKEFGLSEMSAPDAPPAVHVLDAEADLLKDIAPVEAEPTVELAADLDFLHESPKPVASVIPEAETPLVAPVEAAPPQAAAVPVDEVALGQFVDRIENRLLEAVREIVEARLPEIVREVLREEIDRIKTELK